MRTCLPSYGHALSQCGYYSGRLLFICTRARCDYYSRAASIRCAATIQVNTVCYYDNVIINANCAILSFHGCQKVAKLAAPLDLLIIRQSLGSLIHYLHVPFILFMGERLKWLVGRW